MFHVNVSQTLYGYYVNKRVVTIFFPVYYVYTFKKEKHSILGAVEISVALQFSYSNNMQFILLFCYD